MRVDPYLDFFVRVYPYLDFFVRVDSYLDFLNESLSLPGFLE